MATSTIPPGMTRLPRFVFHPHGKGGPSVTLALYDAGWNVTAYRVYLHQDRKSRVVFAGTVKVSDADWIQVASRILESITVSPGDKAGEDTSILNTDQLSFILYHGPALRQAAATRFGWSDPEQARLRADLDPVYSYRRDLGGKRVHRYRVGALQAEGGTRASAKSAIRAAVLNQCSAPPRFLPGVCVYADGASWKAQELPPGELGACRTLPARTAEEAVAAVQKPARTRRASAGAFRLAV